MQAAVKRNYQVILKSFFNYLPSRIFVILNSLIIVPIFAYFLTTNEMSIFQIAIGLLNLVCTCSTDWIAKAILRFYNSYENHLEKFFSCVILLYIITIFAVVIGYFIFKQQVLTHFAISNKIFLLTLFLIIPCGIRQVLYQLLRIFKNPVLYTISIITYQISLLILFFALGNIISNVPAILCSMAISIFAIDFIIFKKLNLAFSKIFITDKDIFKNILIYSIPLIFTNVCIWAILHFGKFVFQYNKDFADTALVGTAWLFVTNTLTPLFSLLLFSIFPLIVKRFERQYKLKQFMTSAVILYVIMFIPFVCAFGFFGFDIAKLIFKQEYFNLGMLFPFCAIAVFMHELMKLMNMKYHLKNKTYIETCMSLTAGIISVILNILLIKYLNILGFGIAMVISMGILMFLNSVIKFKNLYNISFLKLGKCILLTISVCFLIFCTVTLPFIQWHSNFSVIFKIILFGIFYLLSIKKIYKFLV